MITAVITISLKCAEHVPISMSDVRISKAQKKILITMLRYEREELPNMSIHYGRIREVEERSGAQTAAEIAYLIEMSKFADGWKYKRSLKPLHSAGLVSTDDVRQWGRFVDRYKLTDEGKEKATEIEKETNALLEEWSKILGLRLEKIET